MPLQCNQSLPPDAPPESMKLTSNNSGCSETTPYNLICWSHNLELDDPRMSIAKQFQHCQSP